LCDNIRTGATGWACRMLTKIPALAHAPGVSGLAAGSEERAFSADRRSRKTKRNEGSGQGRRSGADMTVCSFSQLPICRYLKMLQLMILGVNITSNPIIRHFLFDTISAYTFFSFVCVSTLYTVTVMGIHVLCINLMIIRTRQCREGAGGYADVLYTCMTHSYTTVSHSIARNTSMETNSKINRVSRCRNDQQMHIVIRYHR